MMAPVKSILDPSFRYMPSHATDVRKTFERIRRERQMVEQLPANRVVQLNQKKAGLPR